MATFTRDNTKLYGQYLSEGEMVMVEGNVDDGSIKRTTLNDVKQTIVTSINPNIK